MEEGNVKKGGKNEEPITSKPNVSPAPDKPLDECNDIGSKPEYGEDAFGLVGDDYHVHTSELLANRIPMEMEVIEDICKQLDIDINILSEKDLFKCYSLVYKALQILVAEKI